MINICLISNYSNGTQLAFKLLDLDYPEKDYQEFQLGIKDSTLINIPINGIDLFESATIIIDNLIPETIYEIVGKVKYNNFWQNIQGCAFITQVKPPNYYGNNKPVKRFMGGAL